LTLATGLPILQRMHAQPPLRLRQALLALGCACAALGAHAAPDNQDVMAQLLIERGVLDKRPQLSGTTTAMDSAAAIGRQMRDTTSGLVLSAMNFLGVPYKRGGNSSDDGFDCSGFTRHIYESTLGLVLPRRVDDQAKAAGFAAVKRDELQPGDLVFFNTLRRTFSHVGIYVGEGKFIHAPRAGGEVRVESMGVRYWAKRFTGARRATTTSDALATGVAPEAPATPELPPVGSNELP
jgi:cell wall-associated NlpC family hydrolase